MSRPTLTIDLDAAAANWRALDALSGQAETGAAVKADGYGCGAGKIAPALAEAGCRSFFVATLDEAIALIRPLSRTRSDPRPPSSEDAKPRIETGTETGAIHILNGVATREEAAEAKAHGLIPCLNHLCQIEAWRTVGEGPCALQLDTGMSRLGLPPDEIPRVPSGLDTRLIFSHLSSADEDDPAVNAEQRTRFLDGTQALRLAYPGSRLSLAATGGTLLGKAYHFDLVRCGIGLYGGMPFAEAQPVVRLDAPILQIREIPAGQAVGYGCTWRADRPARIATLPLGYADGMHRALSNRGTVFLEDTPVPIVGRVSMDLITIDISDHPAAQPGDAVEIIGPNQRIDTLATAAATIGYELLTSLGSRYARRYKGARDTDA